MTASRNWSGDRKCWAGSWGAPPWSIDFRPRQQRLPAETDFVVIGGGFTGLAAAAWLRLCAPDRRVALLEAGHIGSGASGRTGGQFLGETAAGDQPGLGDVIAAVQAIFSRLGQACGFSIADRAELVLPGAFEIGRKAEPIQASPIHWDDSGDLHVVGQVPGGTIHPGRMVSALAQAAETLGASIFENSFVEAIEWNGAVQTCVAGGAKIRARKILLATNGLSLDMAGYGNDAFPKLTLAVRTAPLAEQTIRAIGLGERKPFYTVDFPYLWGRVCSDNSIVWGAGLVDPPSADSRDLREVSIDAAESAHCFLRVERRVRQLHPALRDVEFSHRWGGPILFREGWLPPVLDWHPRSKHGIVAGAYAGHGVALSSYLGSWAAEALLGQRELPNWAAFRHKPTKRS